eukprot:TRINITY_DN10354_c0_g1_i1.p1 TRINITY_DN10354_c0_g1~~TRINITY_DN10354_c0_g1_i1.p1  ORF type:complete len:379 (+),score=97.86 TRINITY_DN10354_c0_g1_i1:57-1193(+)
MENINNNNTNINNNGSNSHNLVINTNTNVNNVNNININNNTTNKSVTFNTFSDNQQVQYKDSNSNWKIGTIIRSTDNENTHYIVRNDSNEEIKMKESDLRQHIPISPRKPPSNNIKISKKILKTNDKKNLDKKNRMFNKIKMVLSKKKDNEDLFIDSEEEENEIEQQENSSFPGIKLRKNIVQVREHNKSKDEVFTDSKYYQEYDEDYHQNIFIEAKQNSQMDMITRTTFEDIQLKLDLNKKILKYQQKEAEKFSNSFKYTSNLVGGLLLQLQDANNHLLNMQNQMDSFQMFVDEQQVCIKSLQQQLSYLSYVEEENGVLREYIHRLKSNNHNHPTILNSNSHSNSNPNYINYSKSNTPPSSGASILNNLISHNNDPK